MNNCNYLNYVKCKKKYLKKNGCLFIYSFFSMNHFISDIFDAVIKGSFHHHPYRRIVRQIIHVDRSNADVIMSTNVHDIVGQILGDCPNCKIFTCSCLNVQRKFKKCKHDIKKFLN